MRVDYHPAVEAELREIRKYVLLPVPINNQIARWQPDSVPANWRDLRRRWDLLHAIRVVFLVIALILLVASCVY